MAYIVRLPGLGMQQDRATLIEWYVSPGESVEEGRTIAEIETEKTTVEIEAREAGVLRRVYVEEGGVARSNDPLAIVAAPEADVSDLEARIDEGEVGVDVGEAPGGGEDGSHVEAGEGTTSGSDSSAAESERRITPRARKRAEELGVDLSRIDGSGPGGAITEDDVEGAAAGGGVRRTLREEHTPSAMRRTIAERLGKSYREAIHVTLDREVDAEALLAAADAVEDALGGDVSMLDVLLVALSATLSDHPGFNATFEDGTHRLYEEHNVGIAVDVERGLITPVLADVSGKSIERIAEERREITERALADEFTMEDLEGGTFTVSNLGPLGVESFDPVIDPPQIAILGVNAIVERATPGDGEGAVTFRRRLPLSLSFDHRVVDGADAARFLDTLSGHIEDPWALLPAAVRRERGADEVTLPGRSVSARTEGDVSGTITAGSFEWAFDEPGELGGDGSAPTPVDLFLGALSACLSASVGFQAEKRDVDLDAVEVTADASPDHGFVESIDLVVTLSVDEEVDDDTVERIVNLAERGCYVADLLGEGFDLSLSFQRV